MVFKLVPSFTYIGLLGLGTEIIGRLERLVVLSLQDREGILVMHE